MDASQETPSQDDIYLYSHENLLEQVKKSPLRMGYHILEFYVDEEGIISKEKTSRREKFYLSPSGGTLRDKDMNIVTYSAKYDKFKGYGKA